MYCQNCGAEIQDGAHFCQNCGSSVAEKKESILKGTYSQPTSTEDKRKKKTSKGLIVFIVVFWLVVLLFISRSFSFSSKKEQSTTSRTSTIQQTTQYHLHTINPKSVFDIGGYINCEGVTIEYKGNYTFLVDNPSENYFMIQCGVYGAKKDGTYEFIGIPSFYGIDKAKYQKDMQENGWAIENTTNIVRPGESLEMKLEIYNLGSQAVPWDVDSDGYYDISFMLHPQEDENHWSISTDDPKTDYYKLRAE